MKEFKVGDKVCDIIRGNGVVTHILKDSTYPIKVEVNEIGEYYTPDGKFHKGHKLPSLYHGHDLIVEVKEPVYEYNVVYKYRLRAGEYIYAMSVSFFRSEDHFCSRHSEYVFVELYLPSKRLVK